VAAYRAICDGRADLVDVEFGIWNSHSLVINVNTNNHNDLEDVGHRGCALGVMSDIEGGNAYFPKLEVMIYCPPCTQRLFCHLLKF